MKKLFLKIGVLIVTVCVFLTGCKETKETDIDKKKNTASKTETTNSITELIKAPTYNNHSHYFNSGSYLGGMGYMYETEKYVFYRNNADNGYLYRLNKETNEKKVIFNKNAHFFIHSIKVKDEQLYFVTQTATDTYASIYTTDLKGGNQKCLAENVENYVLSDEYIYYIGNEMTSNPYVYRYSFADGSIKEIHSEGSSGLNLVNGKLYFISRNEMGSEYITEYDTATETSKKFPLNEGVIPTSNSVYYDNKLYFEGVITSTKGNRNIIAFYDFENQKTEILFDARDLTDYYRKASLTDFIVNPDGSVFAQIGVTLNEDDEVKTRIFHIKGKEVNFCGEVEKSGLLHYCNGEFLIFDFTNSSDTLIAGNDKYNEVVS